MGLFSRNTSPATATYKAAKQKLHDNQRAEKKAGVTEETDTYVALNNAVLDAEKNVPWYRR
jgi:hypothetical protein